jgi:hypothetical protein
MSSVWFPVGFTSMPAHVLVRSHLSLRSDFSFLPSKVDESSHRAYCRNGVALLVVTEWQCAAETMYYDLGTLAVNKYKKDRERIDSLCMMCIRKVLEVARSSLTIRPRKANRVLREDECTRP